MSTSTELLFHTIELFVQYQSKSFLDDLKKVCNKYNPTNILLNFQHKLNKTDSIYFKYVKLLDFKSEYANLIMRNFEKNVVKLVFSHAVCRTLSTTNPENTLKNMSETAASVIMLIRDQRREVPNMLTPKIIHHHIRKLAMPECFAEAAENFVENIEMSITCPDTMSVSCY